MILVMGFVVAVSLRFGGYRTVLRILMVVAGISFVTFLLSEMIINVLLRARKPDPQKHHVFIDLVSELCRKSELIFQPKPRLYILEMDGPNACAYGWGFLGQYAIGITESLYQKLSRKELEAVLAHELAHIRCRDVGLLTILNLITGGAQWLALMFWRGKSFLGGGPFAYIIGGLIYLIARFIFPVGRSAISQQREYSADALGAAYVGSPDPLISALRQLERPREKSRENSILGDLFISHPHMDNRIRALEEPRS